MRTAGGAEAAARRILSDPAFRRTRPETDSLLSRVGRWIIERLTSLGDFISRLGSPSAPVGFAAFLKWAVLGIAIGAVVLGALWLIVRFRWVQRKHSPPMADAMHDAEYIAADSSQWLSRAETSAQQGEWKQALRCLYLGSLMRLDELGYIRYERGATNWQYITRLERNGSGPLASTMRSSTDRFDRAWYGGATVGEDDYHEARRSYGAIAAVPERAA